jgi:hypothetical protein
MMTSIPNINFQMSFLISDNLSFIQIYNRFLVL